MKPLFVVAAALTFASLAHAQTPAAPAAPTLSDTQAVAAPTDPTPPTSNTVVNAVPIAPETPSVTAPPTPSPIAPPAPALSSADQKKFDEVKSANALFFHGIESHDISILEKSLADEAILSGAGQLRVDTKKSFEGLVAAPGFPIKSILISDLDIRIQSQTVVAVGNVNIQQQVGLDSNSYRASFMNVFTKRGSKWQLIVSYSAPIQR